MARKAFPLADEALEQLFAAVETSVEQHGCDHTLRFTQQWLTEHGENPESAIAWLKNHGGLCDCEVVANAYDHWEQNR